MPGLLELNSVVCVRISVNIWGAFDDAVYDRLAITTDDVQTVSGFHTALINMENWYCVHPAVTP